MTGKVLSLPHGGSRHRSLLDFGSPIAGLHPLTNVRPTIARSGFVVALVLCLLNATTALAHKPSDSYLTLRTTATNLVGEWHLALRDLEDAVGLDANDDGIITWNELRARETNTAAYALARLHLSSGGCAGQLRFTDFLVDNHSDGAYAVLRFEVAGLGRPATLNINYQAFFEIDPSHRGLLRVESAGLSRLAVFAPETCAQQIDLARPARATTLITFIQEGIWHIWSGYDHMLFLIALLLPGVMRRAKEGWEPVTAAGPALASVLKIVTAFTVAHSITLSLAALGLVHLPARFVESAIAASVVLAAFNNLVPFFAERGWMIAFGFGLVHGFGFANALRDLGLQHGQLAVTLLGFNVGVELGQLLIVAVFLPVAFGLRHLLFYRRFVLRLGSAAILTLAASWFAERLFDFKVLPF
jgi:hypothetical protein